MTTFTPRCLQAGFTLIEFVLVIAIAGTLVAIALPRLTGVFDSASETDLRAQAKKLEAASARNVEACNRGAKDKCHVISSKEDANSFVAETLGNGFQVENCAVKYGRLDCTLVDTRSEQQTNVSLHKSEAENSDETDFSGITISAP